MRKFGKIFMLFVFVIFTAQMAFAATFTVTKIADTNDGTCDSDCSFREAIAASVNAAGDDIVAFDGMVFGSPQTILLSLGEIIINPSGSLTINGPGANLLTIDGNNASRILTVNVATATINGLTFTRGNGVSTIATGRAGAVYNAGGTTVINNSVITNSTAANGGGLNNASAGTPAVNGNLTLNNCVVSNNTASGSGGGMQNFSTSTVTINNSTFMGNTSNGTTGGGAGQFNGFVFITNSTIANNTAPSAGGIQSNGTNLVITNSTISGNTSTNNGGGLHRATTNVNGYIRNTIISGNNGVATSPDVTNSAGGITSQGNNIIGNVGTSTGWIASDLQNINPMLNPLANNGGPTMTFLPMAGSPAIDAGQNCVTTATCTANNPPSAVTTDQRGTARPQGTTVDIGSVEVVNIPANARVSGRVVLLSGRTPGRVLVTLSNMGTVQTTYTNNFGYFNFSIVPTAQTYTLNVERKGTFFSTQNVTVNGDVSGIVISEVLPTLK